jgi:hypothetical protein
MSLRHNALLGHDGDALIDHTLHVYVGLGECTVLKTEMTIIIDPEPIGSGSKVRWFFKGHTATLTERALGLLVFHNTPPF